MTADFFRYAMIADFACSQDSFGERDALCIHGLGIVNSGIW